MIYFYREKIELAVNLIEAKNNYDDIKALNDVDKINALINTSRPTAEFINSAKRLNKKINKEYPEIGEIHKTASNMANSASSCKDEICSEYDAVLKDLNSDIYGILASVLLKHGKISCIKEFIKSVD